MANEEKQTIKSMLDTLTKELHCVEDVNVDVIEGRYLLAAMMIISDLTKIGDEKELFKLVSARLNISKLKAFSEAFDKHINKDDVSRK